MDSSEEKTIIKILDENSAALKRGIKSYNPGLRAFLPIQLYCRIILKMLQIQDINYCLSANPPITTL